MLRKMRVISSISLLAVMLLLLMIRVLPHHHHTMHLPGTVAVIEMLHFGIGACDNGSEPSHDEHNECPSEHTVYIVKACEGLDYYKNTHNNSFSPAIFTVNAEPNKTADVVVHATPYINIKIPDDRAASLSLRAPPYTVS